MSNNSNLSALRSNLSASALIERLQQGEELLLLDVRERLEYHTYNIGGTNIPLGLLNEKIEELKLDKHQEIIVICKMGLRSKTAQTVLQQLGYTQVKNLHGGMMAVQRLQH
jgi:rhodanese-related sulfurtransferase